VLIAGLVLAGVAALIHVYIFYLESLAWTRVPGRAVFGLTAEQAESTRELAFNQGFYNLFLAIITVLGIVFVAAGRLDVGSTLVLAGVGSMLAASLVLVGADRRRAKAALAQGLVPLLALLLVGAGLLA
jgi:putative membrane protein